jgi:hypothetical protein
LAPTISDSAYAILRVLAARDEQTLVSTSEIREEIGKDPHPVLGRDIIGRHWAWKREGLSEVGTLFVAKQGIAGVVLTPLGRAAFELGRLERGEDPPEPAGPRVMRTGLAATDAERFDALMAEVAHHGPHRRRRY